MNTSLIAALLLSLVVASGPGPAPTEKEGMRESAAAVAPAPTLEARLRHKDATIEKYRLDNGLRIIIWEDHSAPVVAFNSWFAVGSGDEVAGRTGMAHLFEHLMFKETRNMKAGEFDRVLEENGIDANAATWLDWTYYRENLPADRLELVMRLEADRMENMILNQEQLDTEREVVKNERLLRVDNDPEGMAYEVLYHMHYGDHPYGHPTIGWMDDIEAIQLSDCLDFYRLYYAPNNATLVVVGDVRTAEVLDLVRRYYGHLQAQPVPERRRLDPHRTAAEQVKVLELPVAAPKVSVLYDAPAVGTVEAMALKVFNELLFNAESAPIRRRLVEEDEVAIDLGAWLSEFRLAGVFELQVNLVPGADWKAALAVVDEEVERFLADGCDEALVEMGRNRREMSFLRANMSVGSRARSLGHFEVTGGDFAAFFAQVDHLEAVDCGKVKEVVRTWLEGRRRSVVVTVPGEEQ
jgi:zinc protease